MNADACLPVEKTERVFKKTMCRSNPDVEDKLCLYGLGFRKWRWEFRPHKWEAGW